MKNQDRLIAVVTGAIMGLVYGIVGAVLAASGGARMLSANGLTVASLTIMYVGGGLVGGVIVGLLLPLAKRSLVLAMVTGYAASFPFMFAVALSITRDSPVSPMIVALLSSLVGAGAALYIWLSEPRSNK